MAIRFACGKCGKKFQGDDDFAGRRTTCKGCGASLTIPGASKAAAAPPVRKPPAAAAAAPKPTSHDLYGLDDDAIDGEPVAADVPPLVRRHSASSGGGGVPWVLILGGVGAAVLLLLVVVLTLPRRSGSDRKPTSEAVARADEEAPPAAAVSAGPEKPADPRFRPGGAVAASFGNAPWRAKVDPAPGEQAAPIPPGLDLDVAIPESYSGDIVLYPSTPSPFVCIGGNNADAQRREVIDMRDGSVVGRLAGRLDLNKPLALSPDGLLVAAYANTPPRAAVVWSAKDGRQVASIQEGDFIPDTIDFAGSDRLLLTNHHIGRVEVWDFRGGRKVMDIRIAQWFDRESPALSPGRRYLALGYGRDAKVRIYDLANGSLEGELELPKEGSSTPECKGLAYSDDGTMLTAMVTTGDRQHLVTWDAASGKQISDHSADGREAYGDDQHYDGRNLRWLPDGSGWLVHDQAIVERQSGQRVWTLPFDRGQQGLEPAPRKLLDLDRAVIVVKKGNAKVLRTVPLPAEQVRAAFALAQGGGSAVDAMLPPLAEVDLAAARAVSVPSGEVPWTARTDPAASPAKSIPRRPIALQSKANELIDVAFAAPDAAVAAVLSGPGGRLSAGENAEQGGGSRTIERLDLATGRPLGRMEVPPVFDLAAVSPDGGRLLLIAAKARDRLDVFGSDGKPIVGWRPGGKGATGRPAPPLVWADFLDADRVITADADGRVALWTLPAAKPEYVVAIPGGLAGRPSPVLSPGRKSLAVFSTGAVLFLDPADGTIRGRATAPSGGGSELEARAAAFRPDGAEVAAVIGDTIARWDVATGRPAAELPKPLPPHAKVERLAYAGADHLLLGGTWLYSLGHGRIVWAFRNGVPAAGTPDGAAWFAASANPIGAASLRSIELPAEPVERAEALAFAPDPKGLLHAGATVAVTLEGSPPRDADTFRTALVEGMAARLREMGVAVAADAPTRLVARITESNARGMEFAKLGAGAEQKRTVNVRDLSWEIALEDGQGPPVSIARGGFATPDLLTIAIPSTENDWESFLRQQQWQAARQQLSGAEIPYYVARQPRAAPIVLPGATDLGHPWRSP